MGTDGAEEGVLVCWVKGSPYTPALEKEQEKERRYQGERRVPARVSCREPPSPYPKVHNSVINSNIYK